VLLLTGFFWSAGPATLWIETGGSPREDFVIRPVKEFARLHSSRMVPMASLVASSERELTIPRFSAGWSFQGLLVSVFHPEFEYAWNRADKSLGGELKLPVIRPRAWSELLAAEEGVALRHVDAHLDRLLGSWVPAFAEGPPRAALRRYLPGLRRLVEHARWHTGDASFWSDEAAARAALAETLDLLEASMR
jgi:hypothetical protein